MRGNENRSNTDINAITIIVIGLYVTYKMYIGSGKYNIP